MTGEGERNRKQTNKQRNKKKKKEKIDTCVGKGRNESKRMEVNAVKERSVMDGTTR